MIKIMDMDKNGVIKQLSVFLENKTGRLNHVAEILGAEGINMTDYDFVITHPEGYELDPAFTGRARIEYDQRKAFEGADFIYAKNWSAYKGENYGKVLCTDRDWTVDAEKMALTNNAYFMHCLPVRRNMIVTDEVIESPQSIVIPEAANRVVSAQTVLKEILREL